MSAPPSGGLSGSGHDTGGARRDGDKLPRFGYTLLLERLQAYRAEARSPEAMDRRSVLGRLEVELKAPAGLILQRGFDKAYRRVVEGL
jgi:hypothetical protein